MTVSSVIKAVLRTAYILLNNLYAIPTYLIWMVILRPLLNPFPKLYHAVEGIGYSWLLHMVAFWSWSAGYTVTEVGDDIDDLVDDECVVVSNHQSTADVPMLMYLCTHDSKRGLGRNVYWIMDIMFKFTNFGWVSSMHGDFYIRQGRDTRQSQLAELRDHLQQVYIPRDRKWILLFPEGGFLRKRREGSQKYARKNGYPVLEHVTLPRVGAFHTILQTLSSGSTSCDSNNSNNVASKTDDSTYLKKKKSLKWVIDITIAYPDGKPLDLFCIVFGNREPCETLVHFRRYRIEDVPHEEDALLHWMYDRWSEKDQLLSRFYGTGKFPDNTMAEGFERSRNNQRKPLPLSRAWCWFLNFLFIASSYLHALVIYKVISYFVCCFL